jgi:hypothetical protein
MEFTCSSSSNTSFSVIVTPPSAKTGCYPGSCRMIPVEVRIHKYAHTNHKLNGLNIKYYKF